VEITGASSNGEVVLFAEHPGDRVGFLYSGGNLFRTEDLIGLPSTAHDINDSGQYVGIARLPNGILQGFLKSPGEQVELLGALEKGGSSEAYGMNESGEVVGHASVGTRYHAFHYRDGVMRDLGLAPSNAIRCTANAISDNGQIVGRGYLGEIYAKPLRFDPIIVMEGNTVVDVSDTGLAVGYRIGAASWGPPRPVVWDGTVASDLPLPGDPPFHDGTPHDVNNSDVIVGTAAVGVSRFAALWLNRELFNLNALLVEPSTWQLEYAYAITDAGVIYGTGKLGGISQMFELTPVPEPSTLTALLTGAAFAVLRLARKSLSSAEIR
jgi:probable HAF family extracellular repeat protein